MTVIDAQRRSGLYAAIKQAGYLVLGVFICAGCIGAGMLCGTAAGLLLYVPLARCGMPAPVSLCVSTGGLLGMTGFVYCVCHGILDAIRSKTDADEGGGLEIESPPQHDRSAEKDPRKHRIEA